MHLLIRGNSLRIPLVDQSVHCVITSPPYWSLRDYSCSGQLGLEPTPEEYVSRMVRVFREVWRVLRSDGTAFINMGDSYCSTAPATRNGSGTGLNSDPGQICMRGDWRLSAGLKSKDLVGIPWRLAFALQADGWYLRSDIIWHKPNPMPESVTDRPTKSHEYVFMLAKRERYFFDQEAVREEAIRGARILPNATPRPGRKAASSAIWRAAGDAREAPNRSDGYGKGESRDLESGRNIRSVWTIPTEAYPGAHFATFPRKLIEPCIKAGTSEKGVCPECGAPWERETDRESFGKAYSATKFGSDHQGGPLSRSRQAYRANGLEGPPIAKTLSWHSTCRHNAEPVPATVFDPFIGSGTTMVVANALGRRGIGLDLSWEYLGLAQRRIERPHTTVTRPAREESHPLFDHLELANEET